MDAIFQYSMNYMDEPLSRFESYMERASLQLKVELEEYVESTLNTSSSIFINEATDSFLEKFKKAIKLIIERLKEFLQDTKMNIQKFRKEKALEKRINKISDILNSDSKLKSLQIKYKDYTPKSRFIKREKEALKRLIRKKGTTKEELKIFMDRYKDELSDPQKIGIAISSILAIKFVSKEFISGIIDGFNHMSVEETLKELSDIDIERYLTESENVSKEDIVTDTDIMIIYARMLAEMATDELKVQREFMEEFESVLSDIESEIREVFSEE